MPRSSNQKLKPLYLSRILQERTDDENVLTAQELCDELAEYGIQASRQSIYGDIESLRQFGIDISLRPGKGGGYYVARRDFELPELKLLVDAALSSRLITEKKSHELIEKLSKQTSREQAKQLNRQVYIGGRAKALNETVYYSIDAIHSAINAGKKISFMYFEYSVKKKRVYRKNGETYTRTPVAMCWNDDNYYLVTFSPKYENPFSAFRVDRMANVMVLQEDADEFNSREFKIAEYLKRTFGMYSGETVKARLAFDNSLVSVVLDHFGNDTRMTEIGGDRFSIEAEVSASPVFLGWMIQFGTRAEILEPASLRTAMRELIAATGEMYGE